MHTNPSILGKTAIYCDRQFPKAESLAVHAYLHSIVPAPGAELQLRDVYGAIPIGLGQSVRFNQGLAKS